MSTLFHVLSLMDVQVGIGQSKLIHFPCMIDQNIISQINLWQRYDIWFEHIGGLRTPE
jgi:hypothetical protein